MNFYYDNWKQNFENNIIIKAGPFAKSIEINDAQYYCIADENLTKTLLGSQSMALRTNTIIPALGYVRLLDALPQPI